MATTTDSINVILNVQDNASVSVRRINSSLNSFETTLLGLPRAGRAIELFPRMTATVRSASAALQQFNPLLSVLGVRFRVFDLIGKTIKSFLNAGKKLTAWLNTAKVAFLTAGFALAQLNFSSITEFDDAIVSLGNSAGITGEELEENIKLVNQLAIRYGVSQVDILETQKKLIDSGLSYQDALRKVGITLIAARPLNHAFSESMNSLSNSVLAASNRIFQSFKMLGFSIVNELSNTFNIISRFPASESLLGLRTSVGGVFDTLGRYLSSINDNLGRVLADLDFSRISIGINRLGEAVGEFFMAFTGDLSTPGGLQTFLQTLVTGIGNLILTLAGDASRWTPFAVNFRTILGVFAEMSPASARAVGALTSVANSLKFFGAGLSIMLSGYRAYLSVTGQSTTAVDLQLSSLTAATAAMEEYKQETERSANSQKKIREVVEDTSDSFDEFSQIVSEIAEAGMGVEDALGGVGEASIGLKMVLDETGEAIDNTYGDLEESSDIVQGLQLDIGLLAEAEEKATENTESAGEAFESLNESLKKTTRNARDTIEGLKILEQTKRIEVFVDLQIEKVKADAEKVKALFSSLADTITGVGQGIGGLFGQLLELKEGGAVVEAFRLKEAIDQQLNIQKEAAELQADLVKAQTELIQKKIDSDGLKITVEATEIEEDLEKILQTLLKRLQIAATEEAADFLLGLQPDPAAA